MLQYDEIAGAFDVSCGQIRISDPCYKKDNDGGFTIDNTVNGRWLAYVGYDHRFKNSVAWVGVVHNMYTHEVCAYNLHEIAKVGVDSGQLGVFDKAYYDTNQGGEYGDLTTFYGKCCQITEDQACGIVEKCGVVSSSGYGDGEYSVSVCQDKNGLVYCVYIDFLPDEEEEEEYEDEY